MWTGEADVAKIIATPCAAAPLLVDFCKWEREPRLYRFLSIPSEMEREMTEDRKDEDVARKEFPRRSPFSYEKERRDAGNDGHQAPNDGGVSEGVKRPSTKRKKSAKS